MSDVRLTDLDEASRAAADRGNTCLMRCQYSEKSCLRDTPIPPIKQLGGGLLSLLGLILLDRINDKLIEFVVVESVVVTHPVGRVIQGKVKLG